VLGALLAGLIDDRQDHVPAHDDLLSAAFTRTLAFRNWMKPCWLASRKDCCPPCATPPMWKVRMVSWVPGSPIDWAAMMPTASPMLTMVPRARSRP
jgi:hypothetical protein